MIRKAMPDEELRKSYNGIVELKNEFSYMSIDGSVEALKVFAQWYKESK